MRLAVLLGVLTLGGCLPPKALEHSSASEQSTQQPLRIVSLDFCSDQFVLKLINRERILALSPDAVKDFSYMAEAAKGLPSVRPTAENVLVLKPDLIVRSYGGGPNAQSFFENAGVPVITIGWANDIDGILNLMRETSEKLGEAERGEAIVSDMKARLAAIKTQNETRAALYMTPTGVTTGEGSLIHEMMIAAGLTNFQTQPGWRSLPLERLAYDKPDLIAAAFFNSKVNDTDAWSSANHPVARAQMENLPTVSLQGAWTSCGGWFLIDAIEALAQTNGSAIKAPKHEL